MEMGPPPLCHLGACSRREVVWSTLYAQNKSCFFYELYPTLRKAC